MKIHLSHIKEKINEELTIEEVSSKLFQLGHENEINNNTLDIDITPNRGDCLSLNGILRELSAFYNVRQCDPIFSDNIDKFDLNFSNILKEIFVEKDCEVKEINRNDIKSNSKRKSKIIYFEHELDTFFCEKIKPSDIKTTDNFNKYIPVSEFPSSKRDLSFLITDTDRINELERVVMSYESHIIKEIFIFDYYQDEKNKSCKLGFSFIFQSHTKTLQDSEIDRIMNDIIFETCKIPNIQIPGL